MRKWIAFAVAIVAVVIAVLTFATKPKSTFIGTEGYWRIENANGVYWFLSPEGKREFLNAVQTVNPEQRSRDPNGVSFQSKDYNGDIDTWAKATAIRVQSYGFKNVGAWSHPSLRFYIPYTKDLNLTKHIYLPISDPLWEKAIETTIKEQVTPLRNDTNLIGYYTDNEMNWRLNEANAEKYFEATSRLLKLYDPNHLNLGVRFDLRPPISVLIASKGRVDAHSVNQYSDTPQTYKNMIRELYEIAHVPVIITEFSFFAPDNLSGNQNVNWPSGGRVINRQQRANYYERFVGGMAGTSFVIGCDWFQWSDEPPAGRGDGEDLNCGIVSVYDEPYPEMVDATRRIGGRVNTFHLQSDSSQSSDVWKNDPKR